MLTQKKVKELFDYDEHVGVLAWRIAGRGHIKKGKEAGWTQTVRGLKYRNVKIDGKCYLVHRIIWLLIHGEMPKELMDHKDHNGLNNKLSNLRCASNLENAQNRSMKKTNKSGFTGVSWSKHKDKWVSQIQVIGKKIHLGYYDDFEEACLVRWIAGRRYRFHENHGVT